MPAWTTPELLPVWWSATAGSRSNTHSEAPGWRRISSRAAARPTRPPPTTARAHLSGACERAATASSPAIEAASFRDGARPARSCRCGGVDEAGAVQRFIAATPEFAGRRAQTRDDLLGRGVAPEHAAGYDQRSRRADVRRRHRGPFIAGGKPEPPRRGPREGHLVDVPPGRRFRLAVGIAREIRVGAAPRCDQR